MVLKIKEMYDSNREQKYIYSNNGDSEDTSQTVLQSFDSDGFTAGMEVILINGSGKI